MTLLTRLVNPGSDNPGIPIHEFMAALAEYKRGSITGQQVKDAFGLSAQESTHLDEWLGNLDTDTIDRQKIHDVLLLAVGKYPVAKVKTELGITND